MQHYTRIRDLREDSDLTQEQLCKKLYMNKTTYTNYEQGKHTVPLDFAVTLAEFYDVSLDYLTGRTNRKQPDRCMELSKEELKLIQQYRSLSERSKGRHDILIAQLLEQQKDE
ncbi:MAG: helix-turn-helix transcriptional regulator [Ruminococcus sp.]|nr:helix-turn-helix transcriptional regulator [Ruminococcus sp.]MBR1864867.1 helix-turn-helix transcriptional regulator [Ruminococcus sp.]